MTCAVGLAGGLLLPGVVQAQLTVAPQSLSVTVPQYQSQARTVTLTNGGTEPLAFCLSFDRPLQAAEQGLRLAPGVVGGEPACGPYGEAFARIDEDDLVKPAGWFPYGLTVTSSGRLFAADLVPTRRNTFELTPDLAFVRYFEHPLVEEMTPNASTTGIVYREDGGTLWWLNAEESGLAVERAMLLEGDLNGVPTGRQVEIPFTPTAPPPFETGAPVGLAFDAATDRFYYLDFIHGNLWSVDTLGSLIEGYPLAQHAYPEADLSQGHDVHRGIDYRGAGIDNPPPLEPDASGFVEGEGLWWEVGMNLPGDARYSRVVAASAADGSWSGIETPVPVFTDGSGMRGAPVRSRSDPNGAMYYPISTFGIDAVVAVRPHPLPPTWLVVGEQEEGQPSEAWDGTLAPGESRSVALTFQPGARSVGEYAAVLQVFEAASGVAVEVPLSLDVVSGTSAEEGPEVKDEPSLSVWPNPTRSSATVSLSLRPASDLRVVVYDTLGREVAVLHEGPYAADGAVLHLDASGLPSGLYLVRATTDRQTITERITILR